MAALSLESSISDVLKNLYLREKIMIRMDKGHYHYTGFRLRGITSFETESHRSLGE